MERNAIKTTPRVVAEVKNKMCKAKSGLDGITCKISSEI